MQHTHSYIKNSVYVYQMKCLQI